MRILTLQFVLQNFSPATRSRAATLLRLRSSR